MTDWRFHTPGWVDEDLPISTQDDWHDWHLDEAKDNLEALSGLVSQAPPSSIPYVNPGAQPVPAQRTAVPVEWQGFPAQVDTKFGQDNPEKYAAAANKGNDDLRLPPAGFRLALVDAASQTEIDVPVRHRQDEYLEWEPRFVDGKLRSVTFVAEGWDYWEFLFQHDDKSTAKRYSDYLKATVTADDLRFANDVDLYLAPLPGRPEQPSRLKKTYFERGGFNWRNTFNQGPGIVHLSHRANSLSAEINLAITSSLPRVDAAGRTVIANPVQKLMCCTEGGDPNRSSDPHIAAAAYSSVVDADAPKFFTLTDPVGLYISDFRYTAVQYPNDSAKHSAYEWWSVERGKDASDPTHVDRKDSRIVRLHLEVPEDEGFVLGDMSIEGDPITHPGQIAELLKMHLLVDVWAAPAAAPSAPCTATCCQSADELLTISRGSCGAGTTEPFPGLIRARPEEVHDFAAPEIVLSRRRV